MKRSLAGTIASFFVFFVIVFVPFPFNLVRIQSPVTDFIFGGLIRFVSVHVFHHPLSSTKVYSDSASMYILVLLLLVLAIVGGLIVTRLKSWSRYSEKVFQFIYTVAIYYLALQLLKYGADKLFKNQFYQPEPNTLFTPLGNLDRDILYWSTMGTSYFYSVFMGALETIAASLLLFKRTRLFGLLCSAAILLNVLAVNIGFDITVKLFSFLLIFITGYLFIPYATRLKQLVWIDRRVDTSLPNQSTVLIPNAFVQVFLKCFITGLLALEVFYPFIRTGNFNGDTSQRPFLHGAYEVKAVLNGNDTLPANQSPVRRFFIHKESYIIFQDQSDHMQDYKSTYDITQSRFVLTDYQLHQTILPFNWQAKDSILVLQYGTTTKLVAKAVPWQQMPAMKKQFHWVAE